MQRNPTLDGWRGIAILLVLVDHVTMNAKQPLYTGSLGVDIFFVLSGYLITSRLLAERERFGAVSLRGFYLRRAFRILPPVLVYLAALCVLKAFVRSADVRASEVAGSLFFFRNYQLGWSPHGLLTEQFWSLAIEEHFYLLWPLALGWLGRRRSLPFVVAVAVASAAWRFALLTQPALRAALHCASMGLATIRTDARLDGLALGCALSLLLQFSGVPRFIFRNFPKETPLLAAFLLFLFALQAHGAPTLSKYLLLTLMLASTLIVKEGLAYQWLSSGPLVWIGTISYSLYIWQQLFLVHAAGDRSLGVLSRFPINLVCVFLAALASFHWVERPAIAFGARVRSRMRRSAIDRVPPADEETARPLNV